MIVDINIMPHEENHCLEIPSTEASQGQYIGHVFDEIFCPRISSKMSKDGKLKFYRLVEDIQI